MLMVLTAAVLSLSQGQKAPDDFAFRLEYGMCTTDVLDTFQSVFVRDMGGRVPAVSIPLTLRQESLDLTFQAIVAAHFFDYPSEFRTLPKMTRIVTPNASGDGGTVSVSGIRAFAPSRRYKLTVSATGVMHTVSWQDNIAPSTEEANRLRVMLDRIVELIRALPQVQRLPLALVGCV